MEDGDVSMIAQVDERIIELVFRDEEFKKGVAETQEQLTQLKNELKSLAKSSDDIDDLSDAFDDFGDDSLDGVSSGVQTLTDRFSVLGIIGMRVIENLTDSAMNLGKQLIGAIGLDAIKDGFSEYETQMNSIQTILSNTRSEGTTVETVNKALDELNTYADKTIYNFSQMTKNIGTFTAAGVKLDTSVSAIQGIANLAAVSGSTSQQASTAMYQLSQALATGTVKLMDWNSVVNAGMGGQVFQEALKETSRELNTGCDAAIAAEGSFRESLSVGWLTSEVLTQTLKKFTTSGMFEWVGNYIGMSADAVEASYNQALAAQTSGTESEKQAAAIDQVSESLANMTGTSKDTIKEAMELAFDAENAATKVKTFTQLIDTLKEALGSGWALSWRTIVGDFEEAEDLWTRINDVLSNMINESSNARNEMLSTWKDLGGRTAIIDALSNAFDALMNVITPIKEAFNEVFPPMTAERLNDISNAVKDVSSKLKDFTSAHSDLTKSISKGFFSLVSVIADKIGKFVGVVAKLAESLKPVAKIFVELVDSLAQFITKMAGVSDSTDQFTSVLDGALSLIRNISTAIYNLWHGAFPSVGTIISSLYDTIRDTINKFWDWLTTNVSISDLVNTFGVTTVISYLKNFYDTFKQVSKDIRELISTDWVEMLKNAKKSLTDINKAATSGVTNLMNDKNIVKLTIFAGGLYLLAKAVKELAGVDTSSLVKGLGGLAIVCGTLVASVSRIVKVFDVMSPIINKFGAKYTKIFGKLKEGEKVITKTKSLWSMAGLILSFATAVYILAKAVLKLSEMPLDKALVGLGSLIVVVAALTKAVTKIGSIQGSVGIGTIMETVAIAGAVYILASAVVKLKDLSLEQAAIACGALCVMLAALCKAVKYLSTMQSSAKTALASSVTILAVAGSLYIVASAIAKLKDLDLGQAAIACGSLLVMLAAMTFAVNSLAQFGKSGAKALAGGASLVLVAGALYVVAASICKLKDLSVEQTEVALGALIGMLITMGTVVLVLGSMKSAVKAIAGAASILILSVALINISEALQPLLNVQADALTQACVSVALMIGAFAAIVAAFGVVPASAVLKGVVAAEAICMLADALTPITASIKTLAAIPSDEATAALIELGITIAEMGVIATAIGAVGGVFGLLGAATIDLVSSSLDDIANAVTKMSEIDASKAKTGLESLDQALKIIAEGSLGATLGIIGASTISTVAKPLGELADSLKKWEDLTLPTNIAPSLREIGSGVEAFTFGGFGADTITTVAEPLGVMADSLSKWQELNLPDNIGEVLGTIGDGVGKFNFSGWGADAVNTVAEGLGTMADSVKKWAGVTVPDGMAEKLGTLADGVGKFNFSGWGADAIAASAEPLGTLADSVKKWADVTVPEGMSTNLGDLAGGVGSFWKAGFGVDQLSPVASGLGEMADAMAKWKDVSIPDGLGTDLGEIATGTAGFVLGGLSGPGISALVDPLSNFADAITKWKDIVIPDGMATGLSDLSTALGSYFLSGWSAGDINALVDPVTNFAGAVAAWNTVTCVTTLGNDLLSLSRGINALSEASTSGFDGLGEKLSSFASSLSAFPSTVSNSMSSATSAMTSGFSSMIAACNTTSQKFVEVGKAFMTNLSTGIRSNSSIPTSSITSVLNAVKQTATGMYNSFYSIGKYIDAGLGNGILDGKSAVISAATKVATDAITAAKKASGVASPSKKTYAIARWCIIGAVNGINQNGSKMVNSFADVMTDAMNATADVADNYSDYINPTITPVVDLSSASNTISNLSSLLPNNRLLDFTANAKASAVTATFKGRTEIEADYQKAILDSNAQVVTAVASLGTDLSTYTDAIANSETAMYVDGKKLASSIVKPMNQQLGILAKRNI